MPRSARAWLNSASSRSAARCEARDSFETIGTKLWAIALWALVVFAVVVLAGLIGVLTTLVWLLIALCCVSPTQIVSTAKRDTSSHG